MDYRVFEGFIHSDLDIKRLLLDSVFDLKESPIDYSDRLYKTLKYIGLIFDRVCIDFCFNSAKGVISSKFDSYLKELAQLGCNLDKLSYFFEKKFCDIDSDFINLVQSTCIGYIGLNEDILCDLLDRASSMNEILHVMHQYIINNEELLESVPIISQKKYYSGYPIYLRGIDNKIASDIYNCLPLNSENGYTDIISLSDSVIIMVRDRGHALVIEIEKENDNYYVRYFIPKNCNTEMINSLPGVRKITDFRTRSTGGEFQAILEELPYKVVSFIESVPTDRDMPSYDDCFFRK